MGDDAYLTWRAEVGAAAALFEARWTMRALRRVDGALHDRLFRQRNMFDQALVTGDLNEVRQHGAATIRGWGAATKAMEEATEPDDAYFEGLDVSSGLRIAVGPCRASAAILPAGTVFITPDDVAALLAKDRTVVGVLAQWPGAEIVETDAVFP